MNNTESAARGGWRATLLLMLGAFALYWLNAGALPFMDPDEARCALIAKQMVQSGDWLVPHILDEPYFDKPILFFWLLAGAFKLFGLNEGAARGVTAVGGALLVGATYQLGRLLLSGRAAWWAAIMLGLSSLMVIAGRFVRMDVWLTALVAWSLFFWARFHFAGASRRNLFYGYTCLAAAFLTKGLIGVLLPLGAIGLFLAIRRDWKAIRRAWLPLGFLVIAALAGPWFVFMALKFPDYAATFFVKHHFARVATSTFGRAASPLYLPGVILAGFLPWTVFLVAGLLKALPLRIHVDWPRPPGLMLCYWWAALGVIPFLVSQTQLPNYILPAWPALALIAGHYLDQLLKEPQRLEARWVTGLTLAVMVGSLVVLAVIDGRFMNTSAAWFAALRRFGVLVPVTLIALVRLKRSAAPVPLAVVPLLMLGFAVDVVFVEGPALFEERSTRLFAEPARARLREVDLLVIGPDPLYGLPYYLNTPAKIRFVNTAEEFSQYTQWPAPLLGLVREKQLLARGQAMLGDRLEVLERRDKISLVKLQPEKSTAEGAARK